MRFYIRGRKLWGAQPPRNKLVSQTPATVHTLVVHHTAGGIPLAESVPAELRAIQRLHQEARGWSDIGYNVLIDRQGRAWEGRGLQYVGAHTQYHNTGSIGVAFLGNYETHKLNVRQRIAYRRLLRLLKRKGFRFTIIRGHKDMPGQATACPGKNIMEGLKL